MASKIKFDNLEDISREEIAHILKRHYKKFYGGSMEVERRLIERGGGHSGTGDEFTVFALAGSPPKGYCIRIPELRTLNFYSVEGDQFGQIYINDPNAVLPMGKLDKEELKDRLTGPFRSRLLR